MSLRTLIRQLSLEDPWVFLCATAFLVWKIPQLFIGDYGPLYAANNMLLEIVAAFIVNILALVSVAATFVTWALARKLPVSPIAIGITLLAAMLLSGALTYLQSNWVRAILGLAAAVALAGALIVSAMKRRFVISGASIALLFFAAYYCFWNLRAITLPEDRDKLAWVLIGGYTTLFVAAAPIALIAVRGVQTVRLVSR